MFYFYLLLSAAHAYSSMLMNARCAEWPEPGMRVMDGVAQRSALRRVELRRTADRSVVECGATVRASESLDVALTPPHGAPYAYMEHLLHATGGTFSGAFVGCAQRRVAGAVERGSGANDAHTLTPDAGAQRVVVVGAWQRQHAGLYLTDECVLRVERGEL